MGCVKTVVGEVPDAIVRAAMAEPILRGRVILSSKRRVPLMHGDECVGFVTPHETKSGWRAGPIYVVPDHRGHRHVEAYYASQPGRTWTAFVPEGNVASMRMHQRAGFTHWKAARNGSWLRREVTK